MTRGRTRFDELDQKARRRVLGTSLARVGSALAATYVLYALLPLPAGANHGAVAGLVFGLAGFALLVIWQVRSIVGAQFPGIRAIEAVAFVFPALIAVFAYTYVGMSASSPDHFSEALSRVDALYFSTTTLATVGFGDIVPRSETARLVVTGQIMLDLVAIAGIARLLMSAARR